MLDDLNSVSVGIANQYCLVKACFAIRQFHGARGYESGLPVPQRLRSLGLDLMEVRTAGEEPADDEAPESSHPVPGN